MASHLFCAHCGEPRVSQYVANKPVADFHYPACGEDYELKSQKGRFGARVVDGAFRTINAVTPRLVLGVQATAQGPRRLKPIWDRGKPCLDSRDKPWSDD